MVQMRTFERKTFRVQGIRVTVENMHEVAAWAGGTVTAGYKSSEEADWCILITSVWANGRKNLNKAFVGDWITRLTDANNFRIYKDKPFGESFVEVPSQESKREKIRAMVEMAMGANYRSDYYGQKDDVAKEITEQILSLF